MLKLDYPIRKIIYSLIIATLAAILVSFASVFAFSFVGFIILFWIYLFSIWKLESKDYIYYYSIRTIRSLFFFLPISAIFYSISLTNTMVESSWDSLEAWATAVWGAIWWAMVIFLCLIIWLVWGLIIWTFAKKPIEVQNTWRSIWILFLIILWLSVYYLNQTSEIEKTINAKSNLEQENSSEIISTTNTWITNDDEDKKEITNEEVKEEDKSKTNKVEEKKELKLSDLLWFKLTSYNFVKWDWSESFEFTFDIQNKSWKDILWYKWNFELFDLFDDSLWKFNIDKIWEFNSWSNIKEKWNYHYNQFMSENVKLWKANFKDLKYKYNITKIIYKDEYDFSNKNFWSNTWKDTDKINYEIKNIKSIKWDYQKFIEFDIIITNNSEKNIKGIKWWFNLYNIFWEELWSYNINLIKEIKAWSKISEKSKYSINEFISTENDLYESDYDLIKYNFEIENVVYYE